VTRVLYQLNNGSWSQPETTNGWTIWTVTLPLVLGTNKVNAYGRNHFSTLKNKLKGILDEAKKPKTWYFLTPEAAEEASNLMHAE
jgi:hypothetical protein